MSQGTDDRKSSKTLYYLLVNLVRGKALTILRATERLNGALAWRKIRQEYQPEVGGRHNAMLVGVLQPSWSSDKSFADQLIDWETRITEYESATSDIISDATKVAIITASSPPEVRSVVRMVAGPAGGKYQAIRTSLAEYMQFGRAFDRDGQAGGAVPMDVGAVGKGKGER